MRILQVITSLGIGGAEKLVLQLISKLREKGHVADVCVFNGMRTSFMEDAEKTGCKIYSLGKSFYNPYYILKLSKIIENYDIVHTHNSSPQLFAALAKGKHKCMLITTEHNTDNRKRHLCIFKGLDRWMYAKYEKIICISNETSQNLRAYLGSNWQKKCGKDKIITIYNGIDVNRFHNAQPYEERNGKFIIIMVAAFRQQKDHSTLLKAFTHLSDDYKLWLVGDGEKRKDIEQEIEQLSIGNKVKLFGNRGDVPELLNAADIVVLSSNWEGFGLAAVEGMAAGKPVVVSDVDGLRQIVENYGLIFQRGNDYELSTMIEELANDINKYHLVAQKCFSRAQDFDIANMITAYESVYHNCIKK